MQQIARAGLYLTSLIFCISCGKIENPEVVRQLRITVNEATRIYSDKYNDTNWISDNFYSIFFPDLNSDLQIETIIKNRKLPFETLDGIKIYKEVERKDIRYIREFDSYLIRNDFTVIAVLENGSLKVLSKPQIAMQYYHLIKDKKDNRYKIAEVYPSIDQNDLLYKEAFILNYRDFTKDESVKELIEKIK